MKQNLKNMNNTTTYLNRKVIDYNQYDIEKMVLYYIKINNKAYVKMQQIKQQVLLINKKQIESYCKDCKYYSICEIQNKKNNYVKNKVWKEIKIFINETTMKLYKYYKESPCKNDIEKEV